MILNFKHTEMKTLLYTLFFMSVYSLNSQSIIPGHKGESQVEISRHINGHLLKYENEYFGKKANLSIQEISTINNRNDKSDKNIRSQNNCASGPLTLEITFDSRPQDLGWEITDANNIIYAGGNSYGNQIPGSTLSISIPSLNSGDYALVIYDSNGDGLCCNSGNGSYALKDGQTTLLSGSSFNYSDIQLFCVGQTNNDVFDLTPPTTSTLSASNPTTNTIDLNWTPATDAGGLFGYGVFMNGVYIGYTNLTSVTVPGLTPGTNYDFFIVSRDITGNFSDPSNIVSITTITPVTSTIIHEGYFESGWDGWIDGGNDCFRYQGNKSSEGLYSIRLRDNSGRKSSMTSPAFNLSPYDSVKVTFQYFAQSMEQGEDFLLRIKSGGNWVTITTYESGLDFNGNGFYSGSITLDNSLFTANNKFRFQCDASANNDKVFIDAVMIEGYSSGATQSLIQLEKSMASRDLSTKDELELTIYPNPATDILNLGDIHIEAIKMISIIDMMGREVNRFAPQSSINVSTLHKGIYQVRVLLKTDELMTRTFIKSVNR